MVKFDLTKYRSKLEISPNIEEPHWQKIQSLDTWDLLIHQFKFEEFDKPVSVKTAVLDPFSPFFIVDYETFLSFKQEISKKFLKCQIEKVHFERPSLQNTHEWSYFGIACIGPENPLIFNNFSYSVGHECYSFPISNLYKRVFLYETNL